MLDINATFDAFQKLNVLIVGDIMLDAYFNGVVDRISPEAPVSIMSIKNKDYRPGGAANVALNIKALGAKPTLISVIGKDWEGQLLNKILPETGISSKFLYSSPNRRTTTKTRIIAKNQHLLRLDDEDVHDLNKEETRIILSSIEKILLEQTVDVILFQDYNKGVLSKKIIREVLLMALKNDIPTVVDPKHNNFYVYNRATLFKPNLKEINANLPFEISPELSDLNKACQYIKEKINNPLTLITLSDKGIYYSGKQERGVLPTIPRKIADVCGAGDSVVSIAALGLAIGLPISDIAHLANLAGGQVCEQVGVVPINKNQLKEDFLNFMVT